MLVIKKDNSTGTVTIKIGDVSVTVSIGEFSRLLAFAAS